MKNKYFRWFFGVIGTIVLGAIGSGVWEKFLSPASGSLTSFLVSLFSKLSTSYADSLYADIGKGSTGVIGIIVLAPYSIIQFSFMFLPLLGIASATTLFFKIKKIDYKEVNSDGPISNPKYISRKRNPSRLKIYLILGYFLGFGLFFWSLSQAVKGGYSYDVVIYIERSFDIISPKISDQELKELKSEYRQISSRAQFNALNQKIKGISSKNKLRLPEISILKME